jgi:hypothetical protein
VQTQRKLRSSVQQRYGKRTRYAPHSSGSHHVLCEPGSCSRGYGSLSLGKLFGHILSALRKLGTLMEDSPLGLDKWLCAMWLIANAKNGISSYEIHRALGVTQKTAWFLLHRIRKAMQTGTFRKLTGEVEADETYIGGRESNKHSEARKNTGRGTVGKAIVLGLLERNGEMPK